MMEEMIGLCGYRCDLCQFYIKNAKGENHKERVCQDFNRLFGYNVQPADVECVGCRNKGKHADADCPVKPCALAKGVENCAHCEEFICDRLRERLEFTEGFLKNNKKPISKEDFSRYIEPYQSKERLLKIKTTLITRE
jgi:hypothetical protein